MRLIGVNNINFKAHKISNQRAKYFENEFKKAQSIDILTHESTDRDGANSALVMSDYLNSIGVQSRVIISSKNTKDLGLKLKKQKLIQAKSLDNKTADALLCVDFSKSDRLPKNLMPYLMSANKVYCFDHHSNPDLADVKGTDITVIKKVNGKPDNLLSRTLNRGYDPNPMSPMYVDTSAKSAAGIIYRFLEALGKDLDNTQAYNLFSGFVDDTQKRGLVVCDGETGTIKPTKKLKDDVNSYEIYNALKAKLSDEQCAKIAKNIDIMSSLTPDETNFKNSLYQRLNYSKNGKIAYVEIPPNDKQWYKLGMDNVRTSTILNRFRQSVLRNDFNDPKMNDVKTVITFYRAGDLYRMSLHSKEESLLDFFKYVEKKRIPDFVRNSGGHQSRAGGKTFTTNFYECHKWVKSIIECDDFYN